MATEVGIVDSVSESQAKIRLQRSSACASCGSRDMCHGGSNQEMVIEVDNALGAKVGDRVEISLPTSSLLKLSMLVYCAPIAALLVGAYLGDMWGRANGMNGMSQSPSAILGGVGALAATFYGLKRFDRSVRTKPRYTPGITRILPNVTLPQHDGSR